ncbi:hypothetical protein FLP10_12470 [Agromyces intestinalis]|uniref:Uncharacterized protein n=1 Tax=Agromyces intestinalis TaxID=2592652 RepID=A0A5C1YJ74_9MICO|nr:hypothetical protein [Agromyces intestinalis]QEO15137.1 hypothetical protein FLP10_12470 [Agromyces intestinalis]
MPEELRRVRSQAKTIASTLLLAAGAVGLVLAIVNYDWLLADAASWEGRRSAGRGLVAPGAVLFCAFVAFYGGYLLVTSSHSWERVATGTRLRKLTAQQLRLAPHDATVVLERFRSGDPRLYLPLPVGKGSVACGLWIAKADGVAYGTVSARVGKDWQPLPIAVLRENAFVALREVPLDGFKNPATPAAVKGFLDPFLRD